MISVFGGSGFIGGRFCELYLDETIKIPRNERESYTNELINFISTTDNYNLFTNPTLDIETNLILLIEILENTRKKFNSDFTFNFISSWFIYGNVPTPIKEDSHCNPKGMYPITKHCAEQILMCYCETFGVKYRIFRLGNVLGESDKGSGIKKNALQYLMKELKKNKDITLSNGGNFTRDYMYVDDVCKAIYLGIQKVEPNTIMHIASGIPYKFSDLIFYCKDKLNSSSNILNSDYTSFQEKSRIKDCNLDISKLNSLGFTPQYNVYEALDRIMEKM